jgi:uroporphyrinogen decarboxylase
MLKPMHDTKPAQKALLRTLAGQAMTPPPIWLMRQAGRYLPEYRALRTKAANFLDFCFRPELAIEATLQPIRRYGLDAAILFSDILTVPWALGQKVEFLEGEGPTLDPVRTELHLDRLAVEGVVARLAPVYETVAGGAAMLPPETTLIGFAGAPWTVAAYMIEGGGSKDYLVAKQWALANPVLFDRLLAMLVAATIEHLSAQIVAGAEVVQIFDSWAGALAEAEFRAWSVAPARAIADALRVRHPGVPLIGFPRGAGGMLGIYGRDAGVTAVGLDTNVPLSWALEELPAAMPVQGNLDPAVLVVGGPVMEQRVRAILDATAGHPLIFNLGHGVPMTTPPEHVATLIDLVRKG